jgi:hypothetical protein
MKTIRDINVILGFALRVAVTFLILKLILSCTPKSVNHFAESGKKVRGIFVGCDCVCLNDSTKMQ